MNGIGFKNMKVFKENQWFDFKNITLLTGTNNSGKSSIINAMQMLQENIQAKNIDELLQTEFKLISNQNKYGSIETFINNQSKANDHYFIFSSRINSIEYRIKVEVNKGIESYGSVKSIHAIDVHTNDNIFILDVLSPYPEYRCIFNINFKYFVDRFYNKCKKTEELRKRLIELDDFMDQLNMGKLPMFELQKIITLINQEFSVDIDIIPLPVEEKEISQYTYFIQNELKIGNKEQNIGGKPGVFFTEKRENNINFQGFITEVDYTQYFKSAFENGVYNFSKIWNDHPDVQKDFENLICSHYNRDVYQSNKLFCDDLTALLSHTFWEMKEKYSSKDDPFNVIKNLTKKYINSLNDFGLIASMLVVKYKNIEETDSNYVANLDITAKCTIDHNSEAYKRLINSNFFEGVYDKFATLVLENYKEFDARFPKRKEIIAKSVYDEIYFEINQNIINLCLKLSNVYVSSNRFTVKRSYSFNDNSDFTNLLKQVENSRINNIKDCKEFINRWIKEFEIAEELILKPDSDTGNFKAYLKTNEMETLLADYGLGTNQLLPIIFSLGIHSYYATIYDDEIVPRTVIIEEPEANLHPAMQSKLADMFVDATKKFEVQIIVETHSEYLIRKLQFLVADKKSEAKPEDVVIYYFNKPDHPAVLNGEVNQVERIEIDEYGGLSMDFGSGFFDEAINLKINLLKLKNAQNN